MSLHVPMLVPGEGSCPSLVSQITFSEDESDDDLSQMSSKKWYAEEELCHFRIALDQNSIPAAERLASSKPIPMPERKCSTNGLSFDLPVTGETKYETLRNSLLSTRKSKQQQQQGSTLSPIPQEPRAKMRRLRVAPIPQDASKGRMMANAKWDVPEKAEKSSRLRSTVGTLLSTLAPSSVGGSSNDAGSSKRSSFTRISMTGAVQGSMPLKKPTRRASNGSPSVKKSHHQHHSVVSQRRTYPPPLSTMPLTMPIRKPSTKDLLNLPSSGSTNALRKKLSRSKLHQGAGAYNSMMMVPRRIGSTSSMARNQSRDLLLVSSHLPKGGPE